MPYIIPQDRPPFDKVLDQLKPENFKTKGELEYCIFKLMGIYMNGKDAKYSNYHDTVYAATHCGDEFRRRFLDAREDHAREENGDVA